MTLKGIIVAKAMVSKVLLFGGIRKISYALDLTREHLNFEVCNDGIIVFVYKKLSIPKRIKDNLSGRNIIDSNIEFDDPKYRTVENFILGGSRNQMHHLAFGDNRWTWIKVKIMNKIRLQAHGYWRFIMGLNKRNPMLILHSPLLHCLASWQSLLSLLMLNRPEIELYGKIMPGNWNRNNTFTVFDYTIS